MPNLTPPYSAAIITVAAESVDLYVKQGWKLVAEEKPKASPKAETEAKAVKPEAKKEETNAEAKAPKAAAPRAKSVQQVPDED